MWLLLVTYAACAGVALGQDNIVCYSSCTSPWTKKVGACKGGQEFSCWRDVVGVDACCSASDTATDCCKWTSGGIVLLVFLIGCLIASIAACSYSCCCRDGKGCCNKGGVGHWM